MTRRRRSKEDRRYILISKVSERYGIHPQTLRLYEREGLIQPPRSTGNTRLYDEACLERLETILSLTRDMGVNLAGVEVILNMREQMEEMQEEIDRLLKIVREELAQRRHDLEKRHALVRIQRGPLAKL